MNYNFGACPQRWGPLPVRILCMRRAGANEPHFCVLRGRASCSPMPPPRRAPQALADCRGQWKQFWVPGRVAPAPGSQLFVCSLPSESYCRSCPEPTSGSHTGLLPEALPAGAAPGPGGLAAPAPGARALAPSLQSTPISLPEQEMRRRPSCCPRSPQTGESSHKSRFILWTNKC